ncbi:protein required for normal CLN1 and CLN2 G1 cyclin expression [Coemansia sp. RSA 2322]|nr:protein required for normal CLN1 and CLN2 G1 cyclin expression [Coemansia sp. RSA 2322]
MASTPEARVIEVPIDNSNDVLEIDCSQLPEHAAEICDILENEGSALRFYQLFALEYYKQGQVEEAVVALKRGMAKAKANDQTAKVPLLNFLASIYVQKAKTAAGDREIMLTMATTLLTEAERIDRSDANTHLNGGMLALAKRQPEQALQRFNAALKAAPGSVAALLGKARVLFGRHQFQQALGLYQQVLRLRPSGKPDPRIGIGLCLHRLGHSADARLALARAAEVDASAAAPHILLATMDLNDVKRLMDPQITAAESCSAEQALQRGGELLRSAMERLERAYSLQPDKAATLVRLADRVFFAGNHEGARVLAERALRAADTMALQAEAHYQAGRAHHAGRRFDLALDAYQRSVAINDRHGLAQYGLGQMQLQRSDMAGAEASFQRVLERHPRCVEVLRALGHLHARLPTTKAKALEYYEREMQAAEGAADADLFLEAALLYEASSARKARRAYAAAAALLARSPAAAAAVPELWNNLGALRHVTGDADAAVFAEYATAARLCTGALGGARTRLADARRGGGSGAAARAAGAEVQRLESSLATITYNVARFYERCGRWGAADALYRRLAAAVPSYADARLRLAHVALVARADADAALAHVAAAVEIDASRAAAWLMRGNIETARRNVQDARRAFEHVLKDISKHDVYALCSLGNFYLAAGRSEAARAGDAPAPAPGASARARDASRAKPPSHDLAAQNYARALEFFAKCLQLDERCAAAAHGVAIAMAERGCAADARHVFQDVRDAATAGLGPPALTAAAGDVVFKAPGDEPAVAAADESCAYPPVASDMLLWSGVNVAHSFVEVGSYRQAVLAYEAALRRLRESTRAMEESAGSARLFVVESLELQEEVADAAPASAEPPSSRLTDAERAERKRVERDLLMYLVRALYIQAKVAKDIEVMRAALGHIRTLCDTEGIVLPESAEPKSLADGAAKKDTVAESSDKGGSADADMADDAVTTEVNTVAAVKDDTAAAEEIQIPAAASSDKKPHARISPDDCLILFDLALIEQSVAQLVSDQPESQRTLSDLSAAATDIAHSAAAFNFLATWGKAMQKKNQKLFFSPRLATERALYSRSLVSKLSRKLQEQELFERNRQKHVEQWRKQQEEEEQRKRDELQALANAQREREGKLLRESEERNAILREQMAASTVAKQQTTADDFDTPLSGSGAAGGSSSRAKKSKARAAAAAAAAKAEKDDFISDNDDQADYASDRGAGSASDHSGSGRKSAVSKSRFPKARPLGKKAPHAPTTPRGRVRGKPSGGHTDEDADASTPVPRKRRNISAPMISEEDEEEEEDGGEAAPIETPKIKSKAIITDSDDDSEN